MSIESRTEIDHQSLLVGVPGDATLASLERALGAEGLTLGFETTEDTVGDWLARGAPGAPSAFEDPADHRIAGFVATLTNGGRIEMRPSPRRAVGPDLGALIVGAGGRFASIDHVWLRVYPTGGHVVRLPTEGLDLDPPVSDGEAALLDAIARELEALTPQS